MTPIACRPHPRPPSAAGLRLAAAVLALAWPGWVAAAGPAKANTSADPPAATGQALGRVMVTRNGEAQSSGWSVWDPGTTLLLIVLSDGATTAKILEADSEGNIRWPLAPGGYTLLGWRFGWAERGVRHIQVGQADAHFDVAAPPALTCLGTIKIAIEPRRLRTQFINDSPPACATPPGAEGSAAVSLSLPRPPPATGEYQRQTPICAKPWGLSCSKTLMGLKPQTPALSFGLKDTRFTALDTLQPTLAWQAAPEAAEGSVPIGYDLAIWEAVGYGVALGPTQYLPGKRVVYQQGLSEPQFSLTEPLKPKTRYLWSVRLRRDQEVSTWSSAGHDLYLVFAWSQGSGEWFKFETP